MVARRAKMSVSTKLEEAAVDRLASDAVPDYRNDVV
jgi:hypothetical protein